MAELQVELLAFVAGSGDPSFDDLALRVAAYQAEQLSAYGRLLSGRQEALSHWLDAPLVPTEAFRHLDLCPVAPSPSHTVFETSGTTGDRSGIRRVPDLTLYHAAMTAPFVEHVLDGDTAPRPWVSLIPHASALPTSSLSHMVSALAETLADRDASSWHLHGGGLDTRAAAQALRSLDRPALVLTTAFALVNLFDGWEGEHARLPQGSRLMITGGFKGRSRSLDAEALGALIEGHLGRPASAIVSEYGMTEWTSQAYGPGLEGPLEAPPWLALRVLDPQGHRACEPGERGLVAGFDLLNLHNVSAVITSDIGSLDADGRLSLHGRLSGARPRGCGLTALAWGVSP